MYALALLTGIYIAHYFVKKDNLPISKEELDSYIWWVEIGVILGARFGYILFYDTHTYFYLTHPWYIFNPFASDGTFIGISGMSYHGALVGFIIASYFWCKRYKQSFLFMIDLAALSVPLAYIFGRIGNFMNERLIGRATDMPWGVYVHNVLTHPSALYEAFLEGFLVFIILYFIRMKKSFNGQLGLAYMILYSLARIIAECFRQPDIQLGFLYGTSWLTMGILISAIFAIIGIILCLYLYKKNNLLK